MTFEEWLQYGIANDFVSQSFCLTHDGFPMAETENELWEEGMDLCAVGVRFGNIEEWEQQARFLKRH